MSKTSLEVVIPVDDVVNSLLQMMTFLFLMHCMRIGFRTVTIYSLGQIISDLIAVPHMRSDALNV